MKSFLRYYVELPFPLGDVDRVIAEMPPECLDIAAREATIRATLLLSSATRRAGEIRPGVVCVSLSTAASPVGVLVRSMRWLVAGADEPILQGDLELAELGPSRTQLALTAQFRCGASVLETANRAASQRVGESTLKAFVDRLAGYVEQVLGRGEHAIPRSQPPAIGSVGSIGHAWVAAP